MASNGPPQTVARFLVPFSVPWFVVAVVLMLTEGVGLLRFGGFCFLFIHAHGGTSDCDTTVLALLLFVCLCFFFLHGFTDRLLLLFTIVTIVRLQCIELNVIAVVCLCYCCTGRGSSSVCKDICGRMWGIFLLFFFVVFHLLLFAVALITVIITA